MKKEAKSNLINLLMFFAVGIGFIILVSAAPSWDTSETTSRMLEDTSFTYNLTANVSNPDNETLTFEILNITSEPDYGSTNPNNYGWIYLDSSSGILTINSTNDTETGRYNITIFVKNPSEVGQSDLFYFIVNATNDAPNFTNIQSQYNLTMNENFLDYLNGTDEEEHYPLHFNITFFGNCTHASWSGRNSGENCTLINAVNFSNTSAKIDFTPSRDDVGTYWANVTVMDFGNSSDYGCPHKYCTNSTYAVNQTTLYSSVVVFNIFAALEINATDCQNKIFHENVSSTCQINIITKESADTLNSSSLATLRNYNGGVFNDSWFFAVNETVSSDFYKTININITPQKTEIGNWTINFTVRDKTTGENSTVPIYLNVQRNSSLNNAPDLIDISDTDTSINLLTTINLTVYDTDLEIPDKNSSLGGYNETTIFNLTILNASDLSQTLNLTGFEIEILERPVLSNNVPQNKTTARIQFTSNASESGEYLINITVFDRTGSNDTETFNLTILSNSAPYWNETVATSFSLTDGGKLYLNLTENVTDADGDSLTFSYYNYSNFPSFAINSSTGVINITEFTNEDVGEQLVNITVSDGYLTDTQTFNFTINNTNEPPFIETPLQTNNVTVNVSNSNMNTTEDLYSTLILFIQDEDFKIPSRSKGFYNESLNINLTIQGPNTDLFNFTFDSFVLYDNRTKYLATFTPGKSDVGNYNISINVTDNETLSDFISFNLTITSVEHDPVITEIDSVNSSIIETLTITFNATDTEDGNISNQTMNFNITFFSGEDFINYDQTIFNTSSGLLNITFNSSMSDIYELKVEVNDTSGRTDSFFWNITVYDYPNILAPESSYIFSMKENESYMMNFSVNHSIQDNLNYNLYVNGVLRNTTSGYGNATNFSWLFTPNFTDETTCTGNVNLTLNVSNGKLTNTTSWTLQINHTNAPLTFNSNIGGASETVVGVGAVNLTLSDYFSDPDASDNCVNQSVRFTEIFLNGTSLTVEISDWINNSVPSIRFSSSSTTSGNYTIYAQEYNVTNDTQNMSFVYSNNFTVSLTATETTTTPTPVSSGGGGSSRTKPISLKIIVPGPVTSKRQDKLILPITLENTGEVALNDLILKGTVAKNNILREDLIASFDQSTISTLSIGEKKNLTMIVDINTDEYGLYELTVNASVRNPEYNDWAKMFINVEETEDILERITFTEEFIVGNPECAELKELVDEAKDLYNEGETEATKAKLDEAIDACKKAIEQPPKFEIVKRFEEYFFNYMWVLSVIIFIAGYIYHIYKRRKLKNENIQPEEKFNNNAGFLKRNIKP